MSGARRTGGCLCGAVRFSAPRELRAAIACHCRQCRRASGHYTASTQAGTAEVAVDGTVRWYEYKPGVAQGFCPLCGAHLFWRNGPEHLSIEMGALDDTSGLRLAGHIWCAEKGDYYEIADGLPQLPGESGGTLA